MTYESQFLENTYYWVEMRECDGLLSEVWINTVQHSEELICNIFRRPKGKEGIAIQFRGMLDIINPYLG